MTKALFHDSVFSAEQRWLKYWHQQKILMQLDESDLTIAPELRGLSASNVGNVLNNFFLYFPRFKMTGPNGKTCRATGIHYKWLSFEIDGWDKPQGCPEKETGTWVNSPKYLRQTPHEFFRELYTTIHEVGLKASEVARAATQFYLSQPISHSNFEEWAPTLLRVYIAMRRKGYYQKDMTG